MTAADRPWHAEKPNNDLPALPPARELETKTVLKRCITARAALAEFKQAAELIPNQAVLINLIPLLEAKDSSEIENIVTTTDKLFQHAHGDGQADAATKEVLGAIRTWPNARCARPRPWKSAGPSRAWRWISAARQVRNWPTTAPVKSSIPRRKANDGCATCSPTGKASCTRRPISIP